MSTTIPSAPTIEAQVFFMLENHAALAVALGVNGSMRAEQIQPRADSDPRTAPRPFVLARFEGSGSTGDDDLDLGTWAFDIHDEPAAGNATIEAACDALLAIFHRARWQPTNGSRTRGHRSYKAGRSGFFADPTYATRFSTLRIRLTQSTH